MSTSSHSPSVVSIASVPSVSSISLLSLSQPNQATRLQLPHQQHQLQHQHQHQPILPDSPTLAPISLAGSPSNFLLSRGSPPNSLPRHSSISSCSNITNANRFSHLQLKNAINRYTDNSNNNNNNSLYNNTNSLRILTRNDSLSESIGGRSPILMPVSTDLPPMTPLVLSLSHPSRSNSTVIIDDDEDDINNTNANLDINNVNDNDNDTLADLIFGQSIDD